MQPPAEPGSQAVPPERVEEFVRLLGQNQRRLFLYVMNLVPNQVEAEEIIQNANLVMWREFGQFELGTNFTAWACKVAFHQVLAWRKKRQRDRLEFSDAFLEAVAEETAQALDQLDQRAQLLAGCIDQLPEAQRQLIQLRYREGQDVNAIARRVEKSVDAVYRTLSRIRQALYHCVNQKLANSQA